MLRKYEHYSSNQLWEQAESLAYKHESSDDAAAEDFCFEDNEETVTVNAVSYTCTWAYMYVHRCATLKVCTVVC